MAADHVDSLDLVNYASNTKPDVPSGTSRENSPRPLLPLDGEPVGELLQGSERHVGDRVEDHASGS